MGPSFHLCQGFEGLALGTTFVKAEYRNLRYLLLAAAFVVITPLGIAIGIAAAATYNTNGRTELGVDGAFNSVSAGILIYNALVDLVVPSFSENEMASGSAVRIAAATFMFAGYAAMSVIAKWA
jgi:solute carrier family 39 (zinc transporter), member 1/2/3